LCISDKPTGAAHPTRGKITNTNTNMKTNQYTIIDGELRQFDPARGVWGATCPLAALTSIQGGTLTVGDQSFFHDAEGVWDVPRAALIAAAVEHVAASATVELPGGEIVPLSSSRILPVLLGDGWEEDADRERVEGELWERMAGWLVEELREALEGGEA
jgi:hypothetical protein